MHLKTSRTTAVTAVSQRAVVNTERARAALIPISKTMHWQQTTITLRGNFRSNTVGELKFENIENDIYLVGENPEERHKKRASKVGNTVMCMASKYFPSLRIGQHKLTEHQLPCCHIRLLTFDL
jgi:hypothetical protein